MANPPMLPFLLSTLLLLLTSTSASHLAAGCSIRPDSSSTLQILHAFGPCSPLHQTINPIATTSSPWWSPLLTQDESRLLYLSSLAAAKPSTSKPKKSSVPIASGRSFLQTTTYIVRAQLGTPSQPLLASLDTSSDASWFPCSSCSGCPSSSAVFSPATSPSYTPLPCSSSLCSQFPNPSCSAAPPSSCLFNLTYGGATLSAAASQDTISLANDNIPSFAFGCLRSVSGATSSPPPQGLLGLGRGPTSLMSQSQSLYSSTFSYCLPSFRSLNFSGSLRLGPVGQPKRIKTTPLLTNPRRRSLYFVNMTGILVGRQRVAIPPAALAFDPATGAGTVLDAGTMFTRLVSPAYVALRDEFRKRMNGPVSSLGGFDTCYDTSTVKTVPPSVTLEFDGMSVTLPPDNVMIHSSAGSTACLAMAVAPSDNVNSVLNVVASMQQQNHRILVDGANRRIGVARELCT